MARSVKRRKHENANDENPNKSQIVHLSTTPYRQLQDPAIRQIRASNYNLTIETSKPIESMPNEQQWWSSKFVLGKSTNSSKHRKNVGTTTSFMTPGSSASMISHIAFPPRRFSEAKGEKGHLMHLKLQY